MYNGGSISQSIVAVAAKLIMLLILLCLPTLLFAQARGTVVIDKDSKVDSLIGNYLIGNKTNPAAPGGGGTVGSSEGFRVQIFSGSDRKEAYNAQAKFQGRHPDLHAYLSYKEPNFKVHVGDFRSRLEAEKVVDELKNSYTGLFIIPEKINASKISSE